MCYRLNLIQWRCWHVRTTKDDAHPNAKQNKNFKNGHFEFRSDENCDFCLRFIVASRLNFSVFIGKFVLPKRRFMVILNWFWFLTWFFDFCILRADSFTFIWFAFHFIWYIYWQTLLWWYDSYLLILGNSYFTLLKEFWTSFIGIRRQDPMMIFTFQSKYK